MSISVDTSAIFSQAGQIVNDMMPIIALSAGLGLGFGLVDKINTLFGRAI
jgi:hypothetical protein